MLKILTILLFCSTFAYGIDWFVYVVDPDSDNATPIDTATNTPETAISVGTEPKGVAITPDGKLAYVINSGMLRPPHPTIPGSVSLIDVDLQQVQTTLSFTSSLTSDFFPSGIAMTPDGKTVYVSGNDPLNSGYVIPIFTETNTTGTAISTGSYGVGAIALTPDGTTAFVLSSGSVIRIILANPTDLTSLDLGGLYSLSSIAITPKGQSAYIVSSGLDLYQVDIPSFSQGTTTTLTLSHPGEQIALTPDGSMAYITSLAGGNSLLLPVDLIDNTLGTAIETSDKQPFGIAITPDGATAYVTTSGNATLAISLANPSIQIPISVNGGNLAITPDQAPIAFFTAVPALVNSPTIFDASASTTPTGKIVQYAWDFGDGSSIVSATPIISHTYGSVGNFTVTLTLTNSAGTSTMQTFTGTTVSNNGGSSAIYSQAITITSIFPPIKLKGKQVKNHFLLQTHSVNVIKWRAPTEGVPPVSYQIYRDNLNTLIGTVSANKTLQFEDHSSPERNQPYVYYIVSVGLSGQSSLPAEITVY